jgi:glycosyltransferase involved in cell wall biosynthesis/pyruvate-formate lyase-activating enzyme
MSTVFFSIVVPTYNAAAHIEECLGSIRAQDLSPELFEVIVADDCSADGTVELATACGKSLQNFRVFRRDSNGGPGAARNVGIDHARGEWLIFVDADDLLTPDCLSSLKVFIERSCEEATTAVGYDWTAVLTDDGLNSSKRYGRRDGQFLADRSKLMYQYLTHRMDGSVIYTAIRRSLLERHRIRFQEGLHEDVDFIFRVYYHSPKSTFLGRAIYKKRGRRASIINSISEKHIDGYFRAWDAIGSFLRNECSVEERGQFLKYYQYGSIGTIATRVREVVRHERDLARTGELFEHIATRAAEIAKQAEFQEELAACKTLYGSITRIFLDKMATPVRTSATYALIASEIQAFNGKSWSCIDLQHSVFLRADQVRTCCKRFFVNGEMKGDVVLFDLEGQKMVSKDEILQAKRDLHQKINAGVPSACDACPFLEFREWAPLNELDVRYLSLEYHSVCNLKCTYCSDEYYGGVRANYDVAGTVEGMISSGSMENCAIVVWGGGEPVVDRSFSHLVNLLSDSLPNLQQRVLTNSVVASQDVANLLKGGGGQIVTSIDAGSKEIYKRVRGVPKLHRVCENLRRYADTNSSRVTIKYIFTDGNGTEDDVRDFAKLMEEYDLLRCTFQISQNFKDEAIDIDAAMNMMLMFGLLRKAGCEQIYFDELLWHRLAGLDLKAHADRIHEFAGYEFIAHPARYASVVIWGAGQQAKYLMEKTKFFREVKVDYFVDATPEKQGKTFYGKEIKSPEVLRGTSTPVVIAAVQSFPLILEQYRRLGFDNSRLVRELIV